VSDAGVTSKIRAEGTEFSREAVSHVERDFQRGRGHRHAQRQRGGRQNFAARLRVKESLTIRRNIG
jgi:hypothetical protein